MTRPFRKQVSSPGGAGLDGASSFWAVRGGKRCFDLVAATAGLLVLWPVIAILAVGVRLTSCGPSFFRQPRVGRHGRLFGLYKLRTMRVSSDASTITTADDNRITRFGRFLRRFKLDELPQLWNIVKGDMSLVGPRPDVPGYADTLRGEARRVLDLRPGLTGPATLRFRDEESLLAKQSDPAAYNDRVVYPMKVALNLKYLEQQSFARDMGYLLVTVAPACDRWLRLIPDDSYLPYGAVVSGSKQND